MMGRIKMAGIEKVGLVADKVAAPLPATNKPKSKGR